MILQINLDTIKRWHNNIYKEIPRENSEYELGPLLVTLYNTDPFEEIYVLNGPGSFTNLRLGCLIVNTLQNILPETISIYTINKLDFRHTCYTQQAVPQYGILYIGQKKNAWLFDAKTLSYEKKTLIELAEKAQHFREDVHLRSGENKVSVRFSSTQCHITYNTNTTSLSLADFPWEEVTTLSPYYLIEPNISEPKKKMVMGTE